MSIWDTGAGSFRKYKATERACSNLEDKMDLEEKKKEYPLIMVRWRDARSYDDTYDMKKEFDSCACESVGHLLSRNDQDTIIFRDLYGDDPDDLEVSGVLVVPNVWIEQIVYLKE